MPEVYPPTVINRTQVYEVDVGPREYFEFNNMTNWHVLVRRAHGREPAGFTADDMVTPYTTKISHLPPGDIENNWVSFYADPALAVGDAVNQLNAPTLFSMVADTQPIVVVPGAVGQRNQVVVTEGLALVSGGVLPGGLSSVWSAVRAPSVFVPMYALAVNPGDNVLYTPPIGKKFRLLAYTIWSSGGTGFTLRDGIGGTSFIGEGLSAGAGTGWVSLGSYGYVSSTVNNPLVAFVGAAVGFYGTLMLSTE